MRHFFFALVFLFFAQATYAQTQTIRGTITDKQSEYPLIGASVMVVGSEPMLGAVTDIDGVYRIENVPVGRHTVQVQYLGYKTITIPNIEVKSAKEAELNLALEESLVKISDVIVSAKKTAKGQVTNQLATVSARSISIEEAERFSGSYGDPARMAQNYAGVGGASDDRNDIIIRGNSPLGVLWRMEGIDIPNPSHFAVLGTTGGPVSMLNINNLSNSDFFTGAWSADYGNALSGVFDLKLRNGNRDKREYLGQIGFNGFELGAEGPFKKGGRASYLINFRYSTLGVFKAIGLDFGLGDAIPNYQDVTFKFNFPTQKSGIFSVWGIGGLSDIHIEPKTDEGDSELFSYDATDVLFRSNTGIIGASHTYFWNKRTYTKLTLVASGAQSSSNVDSILTDPVTGQKNQFNFYGSDQLQAKYSAHFKLNKKFSARQTFTTGLLYSFIDLNLQDSFRLQSGAFQPIQDVDGGASLVQAYANWQYHPTNKLTLNIGLHDQYYTLNQSNNIEPRLGLKFQVNPKANFTLGAGLHSQLQPPSTYFARDDQGVETNRNLDFSKALHTVMGYEFQFAKNMRLKTEIYYQHLYNIPVEKIASAYSILNDGADFGFADVDNLTNKGTGKNYGFELTLEKFFSEGYYFLTTASIFDAKYKGSDQIERNSLFNSNYVFNGLAGKEFKIKQHRLSFDTKVTYAGGRRYTPVDLDASLAAHKEVLDNTQILAQRYKPYFKLDFKISFKQNLKRISQEWALDLTNITNHKNIFQKAYSVEENKVKTTYQRGFFPNMLYKIYF